MITSFQGEYRFLSNFWPCEKPIFIPKDIGHAFNTVENAYQASKFMSNEIRDRFVSITPQWAKRLARTFPIRSDWEFRKLEFMEDMLRQKFSLGTKLLQQLLDTGTQELIEGNTWKDTFWGQCPLGKGENHLGKLLMKIRNEAKQC